jgi:hypothetical protein
MNIPFLNFAGHNCTHCGSADASRSKRRGIFELALLHYSSWRPYRCNVCDHRFYARAKHPEASAHRTIAPPVRHL